MAFTIERLVGSGVLKVVGRGDGSVREGDEILEELLRLTVMAESSAILFDLRALDYIPSADEARYLGRRHGDLGRAHGWRMAFLAPLGAQFGVARMVETIASLHGASAAAFVDESQALAWLVEGRQAGGARRSDRPTG